MSNAIHDILYHIRDTARAFSCRQFGSTIYSHEVKQSLTAGPEKKKRQSVISVFDGGNVDPIHQSVISESYPFRLSWTHYLILIEHAIIDKLSSFLLELGKGFLFEARQKRFTYDEDNFWVEGACNDG